jgi:electron transfer flavoprotein beta subunit
MLPAEVAIMLPDKSSSPGSFGSPVVDSAVLNIVALVSIGQHPKSGRARRADQDSRAVELALTLDKARVRLLHAGQSDSPALREYLGMGLDSMEVLKQPLSADVVPALIQTLKQQNVDMVLAGTRAECGEASGMTPYLIANGLGWPMVPAVVSITPTATGVFEILQALPRGQRRLLKVRAPFVASVDPAASAARQSAFGVAQRGVLAAVTIPATDDQPPLGWQQQPARKRPKRIAAAKKASSAAERFKAATVRSAGKGGVVMQKESIEEKARAIVDMLVTEGVLTL